eukprot:m.143803 g.143803  ORF g.143803 m.143803 type:complete len:639 (+) comp30336_c0_seq1:81-1997(+)
MALLFAVACLMIGTSSENVQQGGIALEEGSAITLHIPTSHAILSKGLWRSLVDHGKVLETRRDTLASQQGNGRIDIVLYVEESGFLQVLTLATVDPYLGGELTVSHLNEFTISSSVETAQPTLHWVLLVASPQYLTNRFFQAVEQLSFPQGMFQSWQHSITMSTHLSNLMGVSFFQPRFEGNLNTQVHDQLPWEALIQQPQLDGAIISFDAWNKFSEWRHLRVDGVDSGLDFDEAAGTITNFFEIMPKLMIVYMVETLSTMLYLNEKRNTKNDSPEDNRNRMIISDDLDASSSTTVAASHASHIPPFPSTLDMAKIPSYDGACHLHHSKKNPQTTMDMAPYSSCTMILTVYDRYKDIEDRLKWYHTMLYLKSIYVVWNKIDTDIPIIDPSKYRIPIHFAKQKVNSMNNRFRPSELITTECIVNMDDDWNMPHTLLNYVIRLWHHSFRNQVVGIRKNARTHGINMSSNGGGGGDVDGKWIYMKNASAPMSIVLPSGMVYHRKYLDMYTFSIPQQARDLVDDITNCDDLLFNFMVANHSGTAPVFVRTSGISKVHVIKSGRSGLFTRGKHYVDRDSCLTQMAAMFGGMKLRYTPDSFSVDQESFTIYPTLADLRTINYTCTRCLGDTEKTDDCVTCQLPS